MNPYDRLRRPDFQAPNSQGLPWLEPPPMMEQQEEDTLGPDMGAIGGALKQRFMRRGPTAPNPKLPTPDILVADPGMPAPNIQFGSPSMSKPLDAAGSAMGSKLAGGMKSL